MKTKRLMQIGDTMRLNDFLPDYEFNEVHHITVDASPERTFKAVRELTAAELSPLVFWMLNLRNLPARLLGKYAPTAAQSGPFLDQLLKGGFLLLAEEPGCEIVFGFAGQFWKLTGGDKPPIPLTTPEAFLAFDDPAFGKVATNLRVDMDRHGRTRCSTETRIHVSDPSTRRKATLR